MKKIAVILFILPFLASAKTYTLPNGNLINIESQSEKISWVEKTFILPSGLLWKELTAVPKAHASEPTLKETIIGFIKSYAEEFNTPAEDLIGVAECESGFETTLYGDKGKAYGLFQFWKGTFDKFKIEADLPNLKYKSWQDQARLASWAFSQGYQNHWFNCVQYLRYQTWDKTKWK